MSWSSEGWVVVVVVVVGWCSWSSEGWGGGGAVEVVEMGDSGGSDVQVGYVKEALDSPEQMLISLVRWCDWFKFNNADLDRNRCANGLEEIVKNACEFGEVCN
ncbi:hypothetical protein HanXRQr2_Chr12g0559801 [Helianthus annuus]|uniref:Uncharacterized protein n=1 Tax=Helianthus annuus TaxID=4232 RepID=A0A9K3MXP1_HELAN|nr:hypothetical protein HanXRQr2_Chr12g0559801 [Helianthus annuus]KAJ0864201.1 hypothetical protein HanPSC8_Chr12g0539131 [Helianthus annuus]